MNLLNLFKKKARPEFNIRHPDVAHNVEVAFKAGGKTYYRFREERLIPAGRYKYIYAYLKEVDMRMNLETLKNYVKDFKDLLNGSGPKKIIQIGEMWKLVINLESRLALAFEPATVERLASVMFFDGDEDLSTYDRKHGAAKIEHWHKNNVRDFFLTKPMGELLGLRTTSIESLEAYISQATQVIQDLTVDQQKLSLENSSENGKKPL
jgi:hypothetical protein